jgi:hypothetical protein
MRAFDRFRFPLLALGLALTLGCSADSPNSPTAPPSNPVPPSVGINVTVSSSTASLEAGSTSFATLVIRATRADNGQAVPNLTPGTVTTTLGNLGSATGPQTLEVELVNGQATVVLFPGDTVGTASVRAAVSTGVGFASVGVREPVTDTFFLSSVSPSTGSPQGGDLVTINGGGFSEPIRVTFDGVTAVVQSASATQIRVITPPLLGGLPAGETRAVTVSVTINLNEEGQASDSLASGFVYTNGGGGGTLQPTIFSVTPSSGPNEGGTQVTINGDGFEAPVAVEFGDGSTARPWVAAQVVSVSRTRLVVLSPAATGFGQGNLNQLVSIRVTNQGSGRFGIANSSFRYGTSIRITSIAPGEGPATGGTLVTVFGQGFDEPVAVSMGAHAQQVLSVSGSEIVVRTVPIVISNCQDVPGATSVTNIESGDSATGPIFTYRVQRPTIFSVSPFSGPQSGNTAVTITGSGFAANMIVDFIIDGTAFTGNVTSSNSSSISVRSPAIPNTALDTQTCDDNGNPVPPDPTPDPDGERYLAVTANVRVTDPTTGCTATLNGVFTFNPTDTSCRGD